MASSGGRADAVEFMAQVRSEQEGDPKRLGGRSAISDAKWEAIRKAISAYSEANPGHGVPHESMLRIMESFEKLCKRHQREVPNYLRAEILAQLVEELASNQEALRLPQEKLISVTAYAGAVGPAFMKEFPEFADTPNIFRHAVTSYPSTPRNMLRQLRRTVESLAAAEEFKEFRDTPGIFLRVAMHHPSDASGFLRTVQKTAATIADDDDLKEFRDAPNLFLQAALRSPSDPKGSLLRAKETIASLAASEEFKELRDSPGIFRKAAVSHPDNPDGFLRSVLKTTKELGSSLISVAEN
jgi:hypothetical protein